MLVTLAGGAIVYQPDDTQLGGLSIELAAFDGEVGNGLLPVADQSAALTVETGRQARIDEGTTLLSDGFMLDQDRDRGPVPAGTARQYTFGLADANALLDGFRIFRHRGIETDVARVLAFAAADWPAWDTSMVLDVNTVTMPAKTYDSDGGWTSELIPDLVEFTGKTLWVHDLADGSGRCLHYHNLTSGHACGLSVSDVIADISTTVLFPWSPIRHRTSMDLRNSIKGRDQAGRSSIQTDATSIAAHDADGLQHEAFLQLEAANQSDLNVKVGASLASLKDDLDTWTFLIGPLDADALALIRPGDLITVTSSVMGLSASTQRIAHMTLTPALGETGTQVPDMWMAALEIGAPIRRRARVANKAIVDRVEHTPVVPDDLGATGTVCTEVTGGWTIGTPVGFDPMTVTTLGGSVSMTALTGDNDSQGIAYQFLTLDTPGRLSGTVFLPLLDESDMGVVVSIIVDDTFPSRGGEASSAHFTADPPNRVEWAARVSAPAGTPWTAVLEGSFQYIVRVDADGAVYFKLWPTTEGEPSEWSGPGTTAVPDQIRFIVTVFRSGGPTFGHDFTVVLGPPMWCHDTGVVTAFHWTTYGPVAVQETPDGLRTAFTIPTYPPGGYVSGTLHVWVDGVLQNYTEVDPSLGTFTLSWAPATGDIVVVAWTVP